MTVKLILIVNDVGVDTDYFVAAFIDHTVSGMIEALEGTGTIKTLKLDIDSKKVSIDLNGTHIPVNSFASNIIRRTTYGMISSLKGVKEIKNLNLNLQK
jgi:hypothetical protein